MRMHGLWILLASLALPAGGCILPVPNVPMAVPGTGRTYAVEDDSGKPVGDGLLLVQTLYPGGRTLYRAYDIKDGRAVVPETFATRLRTDSSQDLGPVLVVWAENPECSVAVPLVPGYVPAPAGAGEETAGIKLYAGVTKTALVLKKAGAAQEADYFLGSMNPLRRFWTGQIVHLDSVQSPYPVKDRDADEAAVRRAVESVRHRLTELGFAPAPDWFRDDWVPPWRPARKS
jgi:hypothetical protein